MATSGVAKINASIFFMIVSGLFVNMAAAPTVTIVSPYVNVRTNSVQAQAEISFTADAKDAQGIKRVDFYIDNQLVWKDTSYPYSYMWYTNQYSVGNHSLKVIAFNTMDDSIASAPLTCEVLAMGTPRTTSNSIVTSGKLPAIKPVINAISRDVSMTVGHDGRYYMVYTGASCDAWFHNEGVNMWVSADLEHWEYVGLIWSFERDGTTVDKTWTNSSSGKKYRVIWAPEIYYTKGYYYLCASKPGQSSATLNTHTMLYRSKDPEGPYTNVSPTGAPLFGNIDGSLFTDSDSTTSWLCYENGGVFLMNSTMTGTTGSKYTLGQGDEGGFLFKVNSKYYLSVAKFMDNGNYSSYIGIASSVTGPYAQWHEALPTGGHNTYFFASDKSIWGTYFGNDGQSPWRERPAIVKMNLKTDGTLEPAATQPTFVTAVKPPNVILFNPFQGQQFLPGAISLGAHAWAGDALTISKKVSLVEFYEGTTKLGEDSSAPFSYTWANPANGTHTITAKATQTDGKTTTSAPVTFSVGTISVLSNKNNNALSTLNVSSVEIVGGNVLKMHINADLSTVKYQLLTTQGSQLFSGTLVAKGSVFTAALNSSIGKGVYVLRLTHGESSIRKMVFCR